MKKHSTKTLLISLLCTLALFGAACSSEAETIVAADSTANATSGSETTEGSAGNSEESNEAKAQEEPTETPTEAPEPTATEEPEATETADEGEYKLPDLSSFMPLSNNPDQDAALSDDQEACLLKTLASDAPEVFGQLNSSASFEDLDSDTQKEFITIYVKCAPRVASNLVVNGFTEELNLSPEQYQEVSSCVHNRFSDSSYDSTPVIHGFVAISNDEVVVEAQRTEIADFLTECIPASIFTTALVTELAEDPLIAEAIDSACLANLSDEESKIFWTSAIGTYGSENSDAALEAAGIAVFSQCISFGKLISAGFVSEGGQPLSDATVSCIDKGLKGADIAALATGEAFADSTFTTTLFECLTPEELAGLGG